MSRFLTTILLLACATTALAGTFTTHEALEYASPGGHSLLLDLRVPDGAGPHPVLVYLVDEFLDSKLRAAVVGKRRSVRR